MQRLTKVPFCSIISILVLVVSYVFASCAEDYVDDHTVIINADSLEYDKNNEIATALGNVELISGPYVLMADKLVYNKKQDKAEAFGNISVVDEEGNVAFAEYLELEDNLSRGLVRALSIKLKNNSLIAAEKAIKLDDYTTEMYNAVYSACRVEKGYPLWQITSDKSVMDERSEKIMHKNARLEIYGTPILYTPYFSHPTPNAKRKSGFLVPSYTQSRDMGLGIDIPYYYNIAPNMDATITTRVFTEQNPVLYSNFRAMTYMSNYKVDFSVTSPKRDSFIYNRKFKGHIFFNSTHNLQYDWIMRANYKRTYDKTYLKRYDITDDSYLRSELDFEMLNYNEHYLVKNMMFQDLRDEFNDMPKIYPYADYSKYFEPLNEDFMPYTKFNILNLRRTHLAEIQRISGTFGVRKTFLTDNGHLFEFDNYLRADGYYVRRVTNPIYQMGGARYLHGSTGRFVPTTKLLWENPYSNGDIVITPKMMVSYSPKGNNPDKIPNEDSTNVELNSNNLFSENRYPGIDRVEGGLRASYGIQLDTKIKDMEFSGLFGKSIKRNKDLKIPLVSGLRQRSSDYVGFLNLKPISNLDFFYRFRLDGSNLAWHNNEAGMSYNVPNTFGVFVNYFASDQKDEPRFKKQKYGSVSGYVTLTKGLNLSINSSKILTKRKVASDHGIIESSARLDYDHDCLTGSIGVTRTFKRDRDVMPDTMILFKITLKTLN